MTPIEPSELAELAQTLPGGEANFFARGARMMDLGPELLAHLVRTERLLAQLVPHLTRLPLVVGSEAAMLAHDLPELRLQLQRLLRLPVGPVPRDGTDH